MKKLFLPVGLIILLVSGVEAQWTIGGSNIYNSNAGNVGIGTTVPQDKLQIGNYTTNSTNSLVIPGTYNFEQLKLGQTGNGNSAIEFVNHTTVSNSYGIKFNVNSDQAAGLQIQYAPSVSAYNNLNYSTGLFMGLNGSIGLGTTLPKAFLDVGYAATNTLTTVLGRLPEGNTTGNGTYLGVRAINTQGAGDVTSFSIEHKFYDQLNSSINFLRGNDMLGGFISFSTNDGSEKMRISPSGNVLIGKTSQLNNQYKLDVAGNIRANKVVVNTTGADFVFEPSYKLKPLDELAVFVKENHHLPGIEPALIMQRDGVEVGENQTKLLQKIEELTLYLIVIKKENELMKKQNKAIEERLNRLESNALVKRNKNTLK